MSSNGEEGAALSYENIPIYYINGGRLVPPARQNLAQCLDTPLGHPITAQAATIDGVPIIYLLELAELVAPLFSTGEACKADHMVSAHEISRYRELHVGGDFQLYHK